MRNNDFIPKHIPDKVITLTEDQDLLGTHFYVEILKNIIKNCITPFTIGLFGSWGSGKSSIIKTLKEELEREKNKIKVFIYEAWKYSRDDFRRNFLIELATFFEKGKIKKELEKEFYFVSTKGYTIGGGLSKIINFAIQKTEAITKPPLMFPEEFEEKFKEIIKNIDKYSDKIVIAIDEIDRCPKEQVLEILQTVKTFLEREGVVFLLSLDNNVLRKYLQMSREDANEFLRKIFNTYIEIKKFSENELYDFTLKLIDRYQINLPKKDTVASLISQEFSKNPRRIIQFLNTLQNELYLATLQEEKELIEKGAISQNIEMLIKILILKEEYLDFYEKVYDNPSLLNDVTEAIRENRIQKNERGEYEYKDNGTGLKIILDENLYRFLKRTSNIELEPLKLKPFFIIRDVFRGFPSNIYNYIISQDWEKIKEMIDKNQIEFKKVLEFIDFIVNEEVIKRKLYSTSGFNLASLVFKIIKDKGSEIEELHKNILAFLNIEEIWQQIYNFPIKELVYSIRWFYNKYKS